jgi:HlyD family secretion protein
MEVKTEEATAIRSEEMQDIISRAPGGLVRYGTLAFVAVFVIFAALAFFIRYPDIITANVTITTMPAPVVLVSRTGGKLQLLKKEGDHTNAGDLIAYIQSNASPTDIVTLEKLTDRLLASGGPVPPNLPELNSAFAIGELQPALTAFITRHREWTLFVKNKLEKKQVAQLKHQIAIYRQLHTNQQGKLKLMEHELTLSKEKFRTDSALFTQNVISKVDYNQSKAVYLQQQRLYRSTEAESINTQLQIAVLTRQVEEIDASALTNESQLATACTEALKELQAEIKRWKEDYLFLAPVPGTVAYLESLENSQHTEAGKSLFSVVPANEQIVAKAELPLAGSGKAKAGQHAVIRLDNYPYEQFGMLTGKVRRISILPSNDTYLVTLDLPHGMMSTNGVELPFHQQLKGQVEIVTEELNVMERIFYQFRKLLRQQ